MTHAARLKACRLIVSRFFVVHSGAHCSTSCREIMVSHTVCVVVIRSFRGQDFRCINSRWSSSALGKFHRRLHFIIPVLHLVLLWIAVAGRKIEAQVHLEAMVTAKPGPLVAMKTAATLDPQIGMREIVHSNTV